MSLRNCKVGLLFKQNGLQQDFRAYCLLCHCFPTFFIRFWTVQWFTWLFLLLLSLQIYFCFDCALLLVVSLKNYKCLYKQRDFKRCQFLWLFDPDPCRSHMYRTNWKCSTNFFSFSIDINSQSFFFLSIFLLIEKLPSLQVHWILLRRMNM